MPKSIALKSHLTAELPNLVDLLARTFGTLKTMVVSLGTAGTETVLTDQLLYDSGASDLRPSNTKPQPCDHQSLEAMLMRGF